MSTSREENEPLEAGPLPIRESVKAPLFVLRHFEQLDLATLSPPRELRPATLEIELVRAVEDALNCCLPYEILACLANADGDLAEEGFRIGKLQEYTEYARERGCSRDSIAVGRHPDSHAFYCIPKRGNRSRPVLIIELDNFDGSERSYDLAGWLSEMVERRQDFLIDDFPQLQGWAPAAGELSEFCPALISSSDDVD